jgi:ATP-dependent Lon protease
VHIHVPEGATPKDGPSAGIGMCTALISALTKIPVRSDVAMTGEITLRGEVLPIGGLKEKLLAAHRGGITTVLIPDDNTKDLAEIPDNIKEKLDIRSVKWIDEVLQVALMHMPVPLPAPDAKARRRPSSARSVAANLRAARLRSARIKLEEGAAGAPSRGALSPARAAAPQALAK